MKALVFLSLSILFFITAQAQPDADRKPDPQMQARFRDAAKSRTMAVGRGLPGFSGVTLNRQSMPFTQNQLRQRATLMCFWYASCNCFRPQLLDSFKSVSDPRFQMVSFMPDSFMYAQFVNEKPVPRLHVLLHDRAEIPALNVLGGYPVFLLVNGEGTVLKAAWVNMPKAFDVEEWRAAIREALMF